MKIKCSHKNCSCVGLIGNCTLKVNIMIRSAACIAA